MKISLILADDHPAILEGIQAHLSKDPRFEVKDTVTNGLDLLKSVALLNADLVLLDLNMPGLDGLKTLEELKSRNIPAKIVIMTNYNAPELMRDCRLKGAHGYVVKSDRLELLGDTLLKVYQGYAAFAMLEDTQTGRPGFSYFDDFLKKHRLTKREVEIIRLVCQHQKTKEIAERLYLSEFTVHTHRRNIMRKLEIGDSTVALYDFALKNNLITAYEPH